MSAFVVPNGGTRTKIVETTTQATLRKNEERHVFRATSLELSLIDPPQSPMKAVVVCPSVLRSIRRGSAEGKRSAEGRRRVHQQFRWQRGVASRNQCRGIVRPEAGPVMRLTSSSSWDGVA